MKTRPYPPLPISLFLSNWFVAFINSSVVNSNDWTDGADIAIVSQTVTVLVVHWWMTSSSTPSRQPDSKDYKYSNEAN